MQKHLALLKTLLFIICLIPVAHLGWRFFDDDLGANPIEALTRALGTWGLNFLLITLAVTPLRKLTGAHWLLRLRRMLGLYAFFYALLHLIAYLWLDQFFDWKEIWTDILKRPFITVGMAAFLLMLPLAITSNAKAIRQLGGKRWQSLHRLVYVTAMLGVLHYVWLIKKDVTLPALYGTILAGLLGYRLVFFLREARKNGIQPKRRIIPIKVSQG